MSLILALGTPVTLVEIQHEIGAALVFDVIDGALPWAIQVRDRRSFWALSGEGLLWIRGHHTENSEEGAALLSAYTLTK